ncbi:MAG: carboxymuconolactone decarboxylase family protein [Rubripirellula sp.]|jgi:AhpD family alkylhydroperoxidase|nr:carboxymuconolactone decarboxylase family protein [Rubripirellula sp.]
MATLPILTDQELDDSAASLFEEIKETRNTDYINHFWRVLANHPDQARSTWDRLQKVMAPGALDPMVKELIYMAVSISNQCEYCIHSHTASARHRGMTDEMYSEFLAVVGMASQTNAMATAMQVPVDPCFLQENQGS